MLVRFSIFILLGQAVFCDDRWKLFFSTNLDEVEDEPIKFSKPLPKWLKGTLIRNGLGRFEVGNQMFLNALDAFGKLASWKFKGDGTAYFTTKLIRSLSYNQSVAMGSIAPYLMLDSVKPPWNIEKKLESLRNGPDNMNVNIKNFGTKNNDFVVISDYWNLYTVDPYTLDTIKGVHPDLPDGPDKGTAIVLSSAHPLPEYGTRNHISFVTHSFINPFAKSLMALERIKSSSEREVIAKIEISKSSYMHSFAVTEHYAVLVAMPFYVDPLGVLKNFKPLDAFKWEEQDNTTLYVIDIKTGKVRILQTENIFFLHIVNAYESDIFKNQIIIDLCTYKDTRNMHSFDFSLLENATARAESPEPVLKRITLDLSSNMVTLLPHSSKSNITFANRFDFPTINERYRSKPHCYTYGVVYNTDKKDFLNTAIVKKDLCHGVNEFSWSSPGKILNEAYFVPTPDGVVEDDGVLMLPVFDSFLNCTDFTILNATDLSVISSARLPVNIPFGTHGHFFDNIF